MPKKASRRPVRTKTRSRRGAPSRPSAAVATPPLEQEVTAPVVGAAPVATSTATVPRPTAAAARRPVRPTTKAPTLTINYSYLRHDLRTLAVLAPMMVVLVIGSYFVFH